MSRTQKMVDWSDLFIHIKCMSYSLELEHVLKVVGGPTKLAGQLGIRPSAVTNWHAVPAKHMHRVAAITGIPVSSIRPDLVPEGEKLEAA